MDYLTLFALHGHQNTKYHCYSLDIIIQFTTDFELLTVMGRYHNREWLQKCNKQQCCDSSFYLNIPLEKPSKITKCAMSEGLIM